MINRKSLLATTLLGSVALSGPLAAETIRIGIGHQSMVTNTVSGGIVLEKLALIDKYLPTTGKYEDADYQIVFRDYDSGPPITNQMLAGKLEFGVMGDYPLIVNGAKFQETGKQQTRFIAVTGYNLKGTGNGIVVPKDSPVQSLADLAGKSLSTPVGSAAWGMTLKVLRDAGLADQVTLVNQSPPVGAANIAAGKIDAHADFCPWSEIMEFRGTARKIYDGSEAGIPTFHGTVVREAFAKQYPEVVEAVLKATLEAQKWIQDDPMRAATQVAEWTGVEKEVLYLYFSEGGISTMEASIKPQWIEAMKYDHALLQKEKDVPDLDFATWIDDSYLKKAYATWAWTTPPWSPAWSARRRAPKAASPPRSGSPSGASSPTTALPRCSPPSGRPGRPARRSTPPTLRQPQRPEAVRQGRLPGQGPQRRSGGLHEEERLGATHRPARRQRAAERPAGRDVGLTTPARAPGGRERTLQPRITR